MRPIQSSDYAALHKLAIESGHGFTSLPDNEKLLKHKIARSKKAFECVPTSLSELSYLFVLDDTELNQVIGISGIEAAVGLEDSFYHYHISKVVHASRQLNIYNTAELLTLCNDYTGQTEICTLFLLPEHRNAFNGKLLSKVRFMFMAEHRQCFAPRVFAEMRGISDDSGVSPFWAWLEKNFFTMDFPTADYLTGIGQKVFISELMPKYPIYVNLLSPEAQAVIGKVHPKTEPALKLLKREGFRWRGYVDIFDAGPTVENDLENITSIRDSKKLSVHIDTNAGEYTCENAEGKSILIANCQYSNFRSTVITGYIDEISQSINLSAAQAKTLLVKENDSVRALRLN